MSILYHSDLFTLLIRYKAQGTTFIPELGYQMISEKFPGPSEMLCETRTQGVPWPGMRKASLFDPMAIEEVNYGIGLHVAAPTGNMRAPPQDELLLLHYKYLGFEHTLARLRQLRSGLGTKDIVNGWGLKYSWLEVQLRENWNAIAEKAVDVREHACSPDRDYTLWWKSLNSYTSHRHSLGWHRFPPPVIIMTSRGILPPSGRAIATQGWPASNRSGRDQMGIGGRLHRSYFGRVISVHILCLDDCSTQPPNHN